MTSNIRINENVKDIFRILKSDYIGVRQIGEYGPSAFQYFLWQINNSIIELPKNNHKVNNRGQCRYNAKFWGVFIYSIKKVEHKNVYIITDFILDKVNFYNWIYYHQYPSKLNLPKPERWFRKKMESLFDKYYIIKIFGKEKYNLLDNNGKIILNEWVDKINPVERKTPAGKLKVVAYCKCRGFMAIVTIEGQFIVTDTIWKDRFSESISYDELHELINEIELNIRTNLILEQYEDVLKKLLY